MTLWGAPNDGSPANIHGEAQQWQRHSLPYHIPVKLCKARCGSRKSFLSIHHKKKKIEKNIYIEKNMKK